MSSEQTPTSNTTATAMRVRVYPTSGQNRKLSTWLYIAQKIRNAAVEQITKRRRARGKWFAQHKGLSKEQAKALLPEEISGSDSAFVSKWLTTQLEKARCFASREFSLECFKQQLGEINVKIKADRKTGADNLLIDLSYGPDTEKDTETVPYSSGPATNAMFEKFFLNKWVKENHTVLDRVAGCEVNFNRLFPKMGQRKTLAQVQAEIDDLDKQLAALKVEGL